MRMFGESEIIPKEDSGKDAFGLRTAYWVLILGFVSSLSEQVLNLSPTLLTADLKA